jgi:DNA-binding response OmpR family regulator
MSLQVTSRTRSPQVLVCEDEPLLALDLEESIRGTGAEVIGPFRSQAHARDVMARMTPDGAVLDINLLHGYCVDLARELGRRGVPFVVVSVIDPAELPEINALAADWLRKPAIFEEVADRLWELMR